MTPSVMPDDLARIRVSEIDKSYAQSGVYFLYADGDLVYVGQSCDVLRRIGEHMSDRKKVFDEISILGCAPLNRLWLESEYIRRFRPRYNQDSAADPRLRRRHRRGRGSRRSGRLDAAA